MRRTNIAVSNRQPHKDPRFPLEVFFKTDNKDIVIPLARIFASSLPLLAFAANNKLGGLTCPVF